jgi:uncharacterized membrane protein
MIRLTLIVPFALLAACSGSHQGDDLPGDGNDLRPYAGIAESDVVRFVGTEPFWGGDLHNGTLTWTTVDDQDGTAMPVTRFAGRGGISLTGQLDARDFTMMLTEAPCSDGMSDRTYPFVVTVTIADDPALSGCGWSDARPFSGAEQQ